VDIWIDDKHVGNLAGKQEIIAALSAWQREHGTRIFYLVVLGNSQYSYSDYWPGILDEYAASEQQVTILSATQEELLLQLVSSIQEYLEQVLGSLHELSRRFYANPNREAWVSLADFLEGLDFLQNSLPRVGGQYLDDGCFAGMLQELLQAMENRDSVSVADLLAYEWKEWLLEVDKSLKVITA
jgi:hypothetical protein